MDELKKQIIRTVTKDFNRNVANTDDVVHTFPEIEQEKVAGIIKSMKDKKEFEFDKTDGYWKIIRIVTDEKEAEKEKLHVIFEKDLADIEPDPMEWYIKGYVPVKSIVLSAGKRASYKSWGALHMAICMASGLPVFNKFDTKKIRVLYIDEENGLDVLKERVSKIKKGMGIVGDLDNLAFLSFQGIKIERLEWREKLESFLSEWKPNVIIVDCFRRIISAEENDATEINRVFTEFIRPITEKFNITWILIHHLRKGISGRKADDIMDELRGSSELTNYADVVIIFERPSRTDNKFILRQAKCRRSKENQPYIIEMKWDEWDSLLMDAIGTAEEILEDVDMCARAIMTWLEEESIDKFKTKDVLDKIKNYSRATVYRALTILTEQSKIRKIKRGNYQRVTEDLTDFNEVSKSQESHETNSDKTKESIPSIKVNSTDTSDTKVSLSCPNILNSDTPETKKETEEQIKNWNEI